MKNIVIVGLLMLLCLQLACSMGAKLPKERDITKTFFWGSSEQGVFKTQTCVKYSGKECEEWKVKYLDTRTQKDWDFIVNSRMILVNESLFFDIIK